jgi:thiol-disulfide isomerase/thioredoxin
MKNRIFGWIKEFLTVIIIITILLNIVSFLKRPDLESQILPKFELMTTKHKIINSDNYKDRAVVLHFWATWCPTCKLEASNIEKISKNHQVITVAINSGSDEDINRFLKEHDLNFDVINDRYGKFSKKFSVHSFPTTFIYDKDAKIKFSEVGYTSTIGLLLRIWLAN